MESACSPSFLKMSLRLSPQTALGGDSQGGSCSSPESRRLTRRRVWGSPPRLSPWSSRPRPRFRLHTRPTCPKVPLIREDTLSASGRALEPLAVSPPPENGASVAADINLEALRGPQNRPSSRGGSRVPPGFFHLWGLGKHPRPRSGSEIADGGSFVPACVLNLRVSSLNTRVFAEWMPSLHSCPP